MQFAICKVTFLVGCVIDLENVLTSAENFMTGYRLVFDRDNLRLGWSPSDCKYFKVQ